MQPQTALKPICAELDSLTDYAPALCALRPSSAMNVAPPGTRCVVAALASMLFAVGIATAAPGKGHTRARPHIGGSITIKSYDEYVRITLLAVQNAPEVDYRVATPNAGDRYVAVLLRIVNLRRDRYNDSPSNGARLITATRAAYPIALPGKEPNLDEMAAIPPGGSHTGWLTFEVPIQAHLSKFMFVLDSGFAPGRGEWLLD
jgi:hypothetical protein